MHNKEVVQVPQLNFTAEDWARVARDTMAWWAGALPRPLVDLTVTDPALASKRYRFLSNYPLSMSVEEIVEFHAPVFATARYYGDAFPRWWINFGPGMMAGFMGAQVHSVHEPSETVWFSPPCETSLTRTPIFRKNRGSEPEVCPPQPIEDLTLAYNPDNVWWQRVQKLTRAAVEHWNGMLAVGHADLGGNLDILASFRTTEGLLFDVIDHPEEVNRLVARITELWLRYYDELDAIIRPACYGTTCWSPIWSTATTYMLQCDFAYMISPAMFERFVMPDLIACCAHLDHGFYHLDGKGQIAHLDLLLSIPRLRGIQWIPGDGQPPPHEWLPLLKRIRDAGKLCQVFVSPEGARTIVKNIGERGFLLSIDSDTEAFLHDPARAEAFLKTLAEEDISLKKF
jgi:5-methyltetrahydrofolate--homocysteine methyltransferase